jgi:hypothetical protein
MKRFIVICFALTAVCLFTSCKDKTTAPAATGDPKKPAPATGHHSGKVIELGSATIGPYKVRAARDDGDIKNAADAPIDVWVDGTPKVETVRFWIGTQDAKGSIKARAAIEFPDQPNHWHTHAEIPKPLPADSRLWVEIEGEKGATSVGSFELKP